MEADRDAAEKAAQAEAEAQIQAMAMSGGDDDDADGANAKTLRNQFNFSERASQVSSSFLSKPPS